LQDTENAHAAVAELHKKQREENRKIR
jgi:hypothetical protein